MGLLCNPCVGGAECDGAALCAPFEGAMVVEIEGVGGPGGKVRVRVDLHPQPGGLDDRAIGFDLVHDGPFEDAGSGRGGGERGDVDREADEMVPAHHSLSRLCAAPGPGCRCAPPSPRGCAAGRSRPGP